MYLKNKTISNKIDMLLLPTSNAKSNWMDQVNHFIGSLISFYKQYVGVSDIVSTNKYERLHDYFPIKIIINIPGSQQIANVFLDIHTFHRWLSRNLVGIRLLSLTSRRCVALVLSFQNPVFPVNQPFLDPVMMQSFIWGHSHWRIPSDIRKWLSKLVYLSLGKNNLIQPYIYSRNTKLVLFITKVRFF